MIKTIPGTASAFSERVTGGRYIEAKINRLAAARYGFNIEDVQDVVTYAIGGEDVTQLIREQVRVVIDQEKVGHGMPFLAQCYDPDIPRSF